MRYGRSIHIILGIPLALGIAWRIVPNFWRLFTVQKISLEFKRFERYFTLLFLIEPQISLTIGTLSLCQT